MKSITIISFFLLVGSYGFGQSDTINNNWITPNLSTLLTEINYFWKLEIDTSAKKIKIPLTPSLNPYNRGYFIENFPCVQNQIDTNEHYNRVDLGYLEIKFDTDNNPTKKIYLIDSIFLSKIDSNQVRMKYNQLEINGEYANWDCNQTSRTNAYKLFFEINYMTLFYETFSVKEYLKLRKLMGPCLGAEYGEDIFPTEILIKLTHNCEFK